MSVKKTLKRGLLKFSNLWLASLVILTVLTLTMTAGNASAATYYVSPNGSASWSSATSSSTPASADTAMANAKAGDTVLFASGTYNVACSSNYEVPVWNPSNSGTSSSPITFKSSSPLGAIVKSSNPGSCGSPLIGAYSANYVVWDGFTLDTSNYSSSIARGPVRFGNSVGGGSNCTLQNSDLIGYYSTVNDNFAAISTEHAQYLALRNNKIHGFTDSSSGRGTAIIFFNMTGGIIENNEIYNNNGGINDKEQGTNNTYRYNFIHDNATYSFDIMTQDGVNVDGLQIYQNIFARNGSIHVDADSPMTITNLNWYNNTFYKDQGPTMGSTATTSNLGSAWNNIAVGSSSSFLSRGSGKPTYVDYNDYYTSGTSWTLFLYAGTLTYTSLPSWEGTGYDSHAIATDPGFVNGSGNYSLATDFKRSSYTANGRGGSYATVMGAYITGNETIGYSSSGSSSSTSGSGSGSTSGSGTGSTSTSDTTAPTVTSFVVPSTSTTLTIPVTMTASDNVGVTGYMITQSATAPTASSSGWSSSAPTSYTVSAAGTYTLYAWAKDAAGNVASGLYASTTVSTSTSSTSTTTGVNECANWQTNHPSWIFCDDFESGQPLVETGRYFDYYVGDNGNNFNVTSSAGYGTSTGMLSHFNTGTVNAGYLDLGFGANPVSSMNKGITTSANYREMYARYYFKLGPNWSGQTAKQMRMSVFAGSDWSQAAVAHVWPDGGTTIAMDPVSCVTGSTVNCSGYNDFNHFQWLGEKRGTTPVFDGNHNNQWYCMEVHWKLNTPGNSDGVQEFWLNGNLEASMQNLNFVGNYTTYGINAAFFENYWNTGATQGDDFYIDNIVLSTQRIGCINSTTTSNYTITSSAGTGGSITPSGSTTIAGGGSQTFTITPASGYTISGVIVDGAAVGAVSSYTFSNVTANHTISASFAVNSYTITSSAGTGGSITPSGSTTVSSGGSQSYTIAPASGYTISGVIVDGAAVGAVSSYTFSNVTANHTISASFAVNSYTITSSAGTGGSITPSGSTTVTKGGSQSYTIAPASGYTISGVIVDGAAVGAVSTYTFSNVTANHTISASFAAQVTNYTITSSAGTGGSITPSGSTTVTKGGSQSYTITPASGYTISGVTVDGAAVGAVSSYTFSNVTANHTISASFAVNSYTITSSAGTGGSITPSGSTTVSSGGSQSYTIAPASGYTISGVTVDGAAAGAVNTYTFSNVTANHTIAASFTSNNSGTTTTITLSPTSDTYLNLDGTSHTAETQSNTYTWPADKVANAVLMKFDFSSIPAGASIQSATLSLYQTASDTSTTYPNYNVSLNRIINHNPDLSKATGYTYDGTNSWTANTSTYNNIPLAQSDISASYHTVALSQVSGIKQWNATQLIKDWLANPTANYGLMINSDPAAPADTYRSFASSKNATTSMRPTLTITYSTATTYTITASAGTGGSIAPSGTTTVNSGGSQTYTITPATGYTISNVTVDGLSVGAVSTYTFSNVNTNHTIAATFAVQVTNYTITASAGTGGSITPSGTTNVTGGGSQTYTITASSGYTIAGVTVDGTSVGAVSTYTFSNVNANHTIAVTFAAQTASTYTITSTAGSGGSITPLGTVTVSAGGSKSYTITPANKRFSIADVTVDGVSIGAVTSYTFSNVSANHTIAATFKKKY